MSAKDPTLDSGYITIDGEERPATLWLADDGSVRLDVVDRESAIEPSIPHHIPLALFKGGKRSVSLLDIHQVGFSTRLGSGGRVNYVCRWSLDDVYLDDPNEASSNRWVVSINGSESVFRVNGLTHTIAKNENKSLLFNWQFQMPAPKEIICSKAGIKLTFTQSITRTMLELRGAEISLSYPMIVETADPININDARSLFYRLRTFFSICFGKELGLASISFRIEGIDNDIKVEGFEKIVAQELPIYPLANLDETTLANCLDAWLINFEKVADAVHLQMQGMSQKLPHTVRFLTFVQAIESLHRKTVALPPTAPIDLDPVEQALRDSGVPSDVIDRVKSMLSMKGDVGLRNRLKAYIKDFKSELGELSDRRTRDKFVEAAVSTRNHLVHRLEPDRNCLSGAELWNATEVLKAISHLAIMSEVQIPTNGVGSGMLSGFMRVAR